MTGESFAHIGSHRATEADVAFKTAHEIIVLKSGQYHDGSATLSIPASALAASMLGMDGNSSNAVAAYHAQSLGKNSIFCGINVSGPDFPSSGADYLMLVSNPTGEDSHLEFCRADMTKPGLDELAALENCRSFREIVAAIAYAKLKTAPNLPATPLGRKRSFDFAYDGADSALATSFLHEIRQSLRLPGHSTPMEAAREQSILTEREATVTRLPAPSTHTPFELAELIEDISAAKTLTGIVSALRGGFFMNGNPAAPIKSSELLTIRDAVAWQIDSMGHNPEAASGIVAALLHWSPKGVLRVDGGASEIAERLGLLLSKEEGRKSLAAALNLPLGGREDRAFEPATTCYAMRSYFEQGVSRMTAMLPPKLMIDVARLAPDCGYYLVGQKNIWRAHEFLKETVAAMAKVASPSISDENAIKKAGFLIGTAYSWAEMPYARIGQSYTEAKREDAEKRAAVASEITLDMLTATPYTPPGATVSTPSHVRGRSFGR